MGQREAGGGFGEGGVRGDAGSTGGEIVGKAGFWLSLVAWVVLVIGMPFGAG